MTYRFISSVSLWLILQLGPIQAMGEDNKPGLVIFDIELQDASHEGALNGLREDQQRRLHLVTNELKTLMAKTGKFRLIDTTPYVSAIQKKAPLMNCNGCDIDIARGLGADIALLGFVYKVSNLILEIHLYARDAINGRTIAKMRSSIRGNTDASWLHGIRWMFRNRILQANLDVARETQ